MAKPSSRKPTNKRATSKPASAEAKASEPESEVHKFIWDLANEAAEKQGLTLSAKTKLVKLFMDPLDLLEFVLKVQQQFEVELPSSEELAKMTLGEFEKHIAESV